MRSAILNQGKRRKTMRVKKIRSYKYGSLGAASPVRRIDPVTGKVIEIINPAEVRLTQPPRFECRYRVFARRWSIRDCELVHYRVSGVLRSGIA
jgi:hypothetical protein